MTKKYQMSFLDKVNLVITVRDYAGLNDDAALAHAHTLCATHKIVVHQADRYIGQVDKGAVCRNADRLAFI